MKNNDHWKTIKSTLNSPQDLAEYLEVPIKTLYFLTRSTSSFYRKCEEPKSGGGIRVFLKPQGELKRIQKLIDRRILKHIPTHPIIHSYRKGRSQFTNAELHVGKPYVLKADRKDFFPTITPAKVDEVFRNLGFGNALAKLLTSICTYEDQLPQGRHPRVRSLPILYKYRSLEDCILWQNNMGLHAQYSGMMFTFLVPNELTT